ncbi:hypothetical protein GGS23DRAFT_603955 [Durotheca rogersii]|uniref:uncharacterized protein n=1 Tax=Durotheca rogersii TaxID=419775 RepID=UPI00221F1DD8|nr:uncharacterized protein GGS23DRAFT_603955 [Durotheca rogersii]KAI5865380.1 hypothetical protein GGS23DRAFT_603955 [Durotheca rogersii]
MEFAYSMPMYLPPVRVIKPAAAGSRKITTTTTTTASATSTTPPTNTNTGTGAGADADADTPAATISTTAHAHPSPAPYYTFLQSANKKHDSGTTTAADSHHRQHPHHPSDQAPEDAADDSTTSFLDNDLVGDRGLPPGGGARNYAHSIASYRKRRKQKQKPKQEGGDASSVKRSRIPGKRRPPPPGTLPQPLAQRPVSYHSHSGTSSSSSVASRASHGTQVQAHALSPALADAPAQAQLNGTGTTSTTRGTLTSSPPALPSPGAKPATRHPQQVSPNQNRLHKRDSLHRQAPPVPQRPPTPTSPIQFVAGFASPIRRRSSQGKHHDGVPFEPSQSRSARKHSSAASARYRAGSASSVSGPSHPIPSGIMTSNENLGLSSGEGSIATSSTSASTKVSFSTKPFIIRNGRTYIHDPSLLYPLPVDLTELHRQSLRTLMLFQLFGGPTTAPEFSNKPPSRVLEVGCGSAFWSMMCHRYFAQHGHSSISFTGIDVVPLVGSGLDQTWKPDKDMHWRFVQHDIRRMPWPLADNEFDLIMVKDMSLASPMRDPRHLFEEYVRILKPGGVLEFWESDFTIRMLRPHVPKTPISVASMDSDSDSDSSSEEEDCSEKLGAYVMTNNTPLGAPLNPFLVEYNGWATKALDARGLSAVPCTFIGAYLLQETDILMDVRSKRLAVPLSEIRWEREGVGGVVTKDGKSYIDSTKAKGKILETKGDKTRGKGLTTSQTALRRVALETVVGMINCFEPMLKEVSGKSQDEWDGWSGKMMNDLLREGGTSWGECLEVGAWCARKKQSTTT